MEGRRNDRGETVELPEASFPKDALTSAVGLSSWARPEEFLFLCSEVPPLPSPAGSTSDIMTSDHSPVFATFEAGVTSQFVSKNGKS